MNFQIFKIDLEKAEEPEIKLAISVGSSKKQESSRKTIDYAKAFVWITTNWKILQEMGIPDHFACLLRHLYAGKDATVRTGHGKQTGSKLGKQYSKAVYCHPVYLTYM